jgi:hypothetical protein
MTTDLIWWIDSVPFQHSWSSAPYLYKYSPAGLARCWRSNWRWRRRLLQPLLQSIPYAARMVVVSCHVVSRRSCFGWTRLYYILYSVVLQLETEWSIDWRYYCCLGSSLRLSSKGQGPGANSELIRMLVSRTPLERGRKTTLFILLANVTRSSPRSTTSVNIYQVFHIGVR